MTLKSDIGAISGSTIPLRGAPGARPAHAPAHDHADHHDHDGGQAHDAARPAVRFSPFLASALDRLGVAVILTGLVWIGVFWAVR